MKYDLPDSIHDETFESITFKFPFSLVDSGMEMKLLSSAGGGFIDYGENIAIDSNDNTKIVIKTHDIALPVGVYNYRIKLRVNGIKRTYLKGTWRITDG